MSDDPALSAIIANNDAAEARALLGLKLAGDALLARPRSPSAKRDYKNAQLKLADVREFSELRIRSHYEAKNPKPKNQ